MRAYASTNACWRRQHICPATLGLNLSRNSYTAFTRTHTYIVSTMAGKMERINITRKPRGPGQLNQAPQNTPRRGQNLTQHRNYPRRPLISNINHDTPQKLTTILQQIETHGHSILTMIVDFLNRTDIEDGDALMCDRFRTRSTRELRDGLKFSRKKDAAQQTLMKQLITMRGSLPTHSLIKFYESKEQLVKQHQELKAFTALCESKLRLIRIFNNLGVKHQHGIKSLDFKDALPEILERNLKKLESEEETGPNKEQTITDDGLDDGLNDRKVDAQDLPETTDIK